MKKAINEFLAWWAAGLAYFIPQRLKTPRKRLSAYVLATPAEDGFDLEYIASNTPADEPPKRLAIRAGSERESVRAWLADTRISKAPIVFRMPNDDVLSRRMTVPAVPLDQVRSMLEFEIDRQTPFSGKQVYFDFSLIAGGSNSRQLEFELGVSPRALVDGLVERLEKWGICPQVIDTDGIRYDETGFNLREPDATSEGNDNKRNLFLYAAVACAIIATPCLLSYYRAETRIHELESMEREVRVQAMDVNALRKTRDDLDDQRKFMGALQSTGPNPLQIIDELTRLLPDDSWIIRFEIKNKDIIIQGESANASALIQVLQDSSLMTAPRFMSPITVNAASGKERFRIAMSIAEGDPA